MSATIAYIVAGLSMTLAPGVWIRILLLDLDAFGRGYFVLVGSGLAVIGSYYVVISRHKSSQIPNHGPLLGTIVSRLLLVNAVLIIFYIWRMINARFALMFGILDSTLAVITYIIWSMEYKSASFITLLQEAWSAVKLFSDKTPPYGILQVLGLVQFILGFTVPSLLMSSSVVPSNIEGSHVEGMFRCYFVTLALHAVLHILASGVQNDSLVIASIFYRVVWNIPVLFLLGILSQIPKALSSILIVYDAIFVIVIAVLFTRQHHFKPN